MSRSPDHWGEFLEISSATDVGMRRASNQDNLMMALNSTFEGWMEKGHLFVVADGMGAHAAGELASEIAVDKIPHLYKKFKELSAPEALKESIVEANAIIHRRGQANEDFYNMGTTCSTLAILPQGALVGHVGDSRVYRMRNNTLEQLTFDHSLVWEMQATGQISPSDVESSVIPKNVITRSLGPYAEVKVDLEGPFPIEVGDTFLLCSDGLTGPVADNEIGPILANLPPEEAAKVLIDLANLRGGPDNISVIVVKVIHPKIATRNTHSGPIVVGKKSPNKTLHPLSWPIVAGGVIAAVVVFLATKSLIASAIPGSISLLALLWVAIQLSGGSRGTALTGGSMFGKGPYVRVNCAAGKDLVQQLDKITSELTKAAVEEAWLLDWEKMKTFIRQADEASQRNNHAVAIRHYSRAISFMMDQLRGRDDSASNSSIEL